MISKFFKKNIKKNYYAWHLKRNYIASATILSQSSCASAPFRNTVLTSSVDSASPEMGDKRTRRISARDGSSILEKFQRPTIEDISPGGLFCWIGKICMWIIFQVLIFINFSWKIPVIFVIFCNIKYILIWNYFFFI